VIFPLLLYLSHHKSTCLKFFCRNQRQHHSYIFFQLNPFDLENDKGGEFVIDSPINTLVKLLPNNTNQELAPQLHIQPKEGLLISFPSWLMHGTLEYTSTEVPRISISWNINIK
jgi:hypothetical protein